MLSGLNSSLKKIDLSWNHIRSQGAAVMAKGFGVVIIKEIQKKTKR